MAILVRKDYCYLIMKFVCEKKKKLQESPLKKKTLKQNKFRTKSKIFVSSKILSYISSKIRNYFSNLFLIFSIKPGNQYNIPNE